jgi:Zn-dependent peptidase ImmA (M78 family)
MTTSPIKKQAAEDAAKLLRTVWGARIPVDPIAIARATGLRVVDASLAENVLGALVKKPGQEPTILLNDNDPENRRRFTCAHELGHFVRRDKEPDEYETIDFRGPLSATGNDAEEIYANEFAACLLMPEADVRRMTAAGLSDLDMALRFQVSREALQFRLANIFLP